MTEYRCRRVRPNSEDTWTTVEESSPGRAANEYHAKMFASDSCCFVQPTPDGGKEKVLFAVIEVDGHGKFTSRVYYRGIWRKGGVPLPRKKTDDEILRDIANVLEYTGSPRDLLDPGWDEEEEEWK